MTMDEFDHRKVYICPADAYGGWFVCAPEQIGLWFWTM